MQSLGEYLILSDIIISDSRFSDILRLYFLDFYLLTTVVLR